ILPQLHSLTINNIDYIQNSTLFYICIFRLPKLKYCKIKFESKDDVQLLPKSTDKFSPIECLVINHSFRFQSFNNLLSYLYQLRHLSINYLNGFDLKHMEFYPIVLKNLKYISLELDLVPFNQLEKLIKNFFYYVEVLRLTTKADSTYLDAKKWEQLIVSYMPNPRIFDINHEGSQQINQVTYHDLINQFNSSFYIEKKWFFTHQHYWQETIKSGIFYSTNPYRKDYTFYWELDEQLCSHLQEKNLNSVKHLHMCSNPVTDTCINYFPNVTSLTITDSFQTSDDPISQTLNRMVSLKKSISWVASSIPGDATSIPSNATSIPGDATSIPGDATSIPSNATSIPGDATSIPSNATSIPGDATSITELLHLLCFTSNLYILKFDSICFCKNTVTSIQQKEEFHHISDVNKLKRLHIRETCTFEEIKMLVDLFSQLQYL
ncbi:unnamed protein product, partial [Rotaria sordida]